MKFKMFDDLVEYVGEEKWEDIFENSEEDESIALLDTIAKLGECCGRMDAIIEIYPQKEVLEELERARNEYFAAIIVFLQRKGVIFDKLYA